MPPSRYVAAYEKAYHDLYQRIEAKDLAGAKTAITAVTAVVNLSMTPPTAPGH